MGLDTVMRTLIIAGLIASAFLVRESMAAPANPMPSQQQVLTFIADTIDWYRHLPTAQGTGTKPGNLLFLEDNRSITRDVVRLSFEVGKAIAFIDSSKNSPGPETTPDPLPAKTELQHLMLAKTRADADTNEAMTQLTSLTQAKLSARGADRSKLDTQMAESEAKLSGLRSRGRRPAGPVF